MIAAFARSGLGILAVMSLSANAGPSATNDQTAVAWASAHGVALGHVDSPVSRDEAATISRIIAGARVIGLGEPFHGHEEPLAYRNRMVRYLVQRQGLTAVALESGMAETKRVGDYILGGNGDARAVVLANLSWRFNELTANVELVSWLRAWNLAHSKRQVRLYGIDVSGGDSKAEFGHSRAALDHVIAYLARAAPQRSFVLREDLGAFTVQFSNAGYAAMDAAGKARLRQVLAASTSFLTSNRASLIRASSLADYDWALRIAQDAQDAERIFAVWPGDPAQPLPGAALVAQIRDRAMAANTLWALGREGPRGRILLFESNTHVTAAPMVRPGRENDPATSAGQELRKALGPAYRVIVTASSLGHDAVDPSIGSVDRIMVAAGRPRALLDIRTAPPWWNSPQTLAHGGARVNAVTPARAFDGIVYVDNLSPAKLLTKETPR